jgi:hypothetical protein
MNPSLQGREIRIVPTLKYLKKNELMAMQMSETAIMTPGLLDPIGSVVASVPFSSDALSDDARPEE